MDANEIRYAYFSKLSNPPFTSKRITVQYINFQAPFVEILTYSSYWFLIQLVLV